MILDDERQRELLLQLMEAAQYPGNALDEAYNLKQAIVNAKLKDKE